MKCLACFKGNQYTETTPGHFDQKQTDEKIADEYKVGKATVEQKTYLIGKKYKKAKKSVGRPEGKLGQNVPIKSTAEKIAEEHKVNEKTVKRAGITNRFNFSSF